MSLVFSGNDPIGLVRLNINNKGLALETFKNNKELAERALRSCMFDFESIEEWKEWINHTVHEIEEEWE